jgi:hypothetical protein
MRFLIPSARALLLLTGALLVPACSKDRTDPPILLAMIPDGTNVPRQVTIYLRYNKALDQSTVNGNYFILSDAVSGGVIPCTVTWHAPLNEVRMVPTGAIGHDTLEKDYLITAVAGIKSVDGGVVGITLFTDFKTRITTDITRPTFLGITSIDTPASPTQLTLNWTNGTDDVGVDHYDVFISNSSGTQDLTAPSRQAPGTPYTVTGLAANTTYFFIVRAVDAVGNTDVNTAELSATTTP